MLRPIMCLPNDIHQYWYLYVYIYICIYEWYPSSSNICVYLYITDQIYANGDQPVCNCYIRFQRAEIWLFLSVKLSVISNSYCKQDGHWIVCAKYVFIAYTLYIYVLLMVLSVIIARVWTITFATLNLCLFFLLCICWPPVTFSWNITSIYKRRNHVTKLTPPLLIEKYRSFSSLISRIVLPLAPLLIARRCRTPSEQIPGAQIPKRPMLSYKTQREFIASFPTYMTSSYHGAWIITKINKLSSESDRNCLISKHSNQCQFSALFVGGYNTASASRLFAQICLIAGNTRYTSIDSHDVYKLVATETWWRRNEYSAHRRMSRK